jgi:hypothetical protein
MGSGAPDHQLKIRIVDAFGYVDKIPVYEVAPVTGRYYATPPTLTDTDFQAALLDVNGRFIVKAILDATSAEIDVDVVDRWTRQLGQVDLARVLGAALAHTNPVIVRLTDGTSAFIDPRQATVQNWPSDYPDSAVKTLLGAGLPAALDSLSLKVKEQSPITGFATSALQTTLNGYVDGIEALLGAGLPSALSTDALKVREQSPITTIDVTDEAARLLGEVDNLKKWGGIALTGRDISLDFAKLTDIETNTDGLLKTADLSLEAITKHLAVDVQNYPATYPDTDTEPRNISKIGGTAQTGADWTPLLQKLDVALSTKARLQPWYQTNFISFQKNYTAGAVAPHADAERWIYTVPANRIAKVMCLSISMTRDAVPTTAAAAKCGIIKDGNSWLLRFDETQTALGVVRQSAIGESIIMSAGQNLGAHTEDLSTGGTYRYNLSANIMEFDV